MWKICSFIILICSLSAHGNQDGEVTPCFSTSILGRWYNELGSELVILNSSENAITGAAFISGEFRSAVERFNGSSGSKVPVMKGVAKLNEKKRSILGFTVVHNDGLSTTSFIGECVVCHGEEALLMTWVLRKYVSDPRDRWHATMIGQNTFTRKDRVQGPRRSYPYSVPKRPASQICLDENENARIRARLETSETSIEGVWFSSTATELDLKMEETQHGNILKGNYSHPLCEVHGPSVNPYTKGTFGFSALRVQENDVRVWVGQLLQKPNGDQVLDTSYLQVTNVKSCEDFKGPVLFGTEEFTRTRNSGGFSLKPIPSAFERFKSSMSNFFSSLFWT